VILVVLLYGALLIGLGCRIEIALAGQLYALASYFLGSRILLTFERRSAVSIANPVARALLATTLGCIGYGTTLGLLLHWTTDVRWMSGTVWILNLAAIALAARAWKSDPATATDRIRESIRALSHHRFEAALAVAICLCTVVGFSNSPNQNFVRAGIAYEQLDPPVPNWGYQGDKGTHLILRSQQILAQGLPSANVGHRGMQLSILPIPLSLGSTNARDFVDAFKLVTLWVWVGLLLTIRMIGREIYNLSERTSMLLEVSIIFMGAISIPVISWPSSTYAGFMKPGLSTFHNMTQLYSLMVASTGFYLLMHSFKNRRSGILLGVLLICASFFYKPSTFTLVAPIVLGWGILSMRSLTFREVVSLSVLCAIPVGWFLYLRMIGIQSPPLNPEFAPFLLYFGRAAWHFPGLVLSSPWFLGTAILVCSFLFVLLVGLPRVKSILDFRFRREELIYAIPLSLLLVGTVVSLVLVENNDRQSHGNFAWLGHTGYFLAVPMFFSLFEGIRSSAYKTMCYAVLLLHIAAGVQHLAYFTIQGKILGPELRAVRVPTAATTPSPPPLARQLAGPTNQE